MTPKEKAQELAMKFDKYGETDNAKQCALIAVEEILKAVKKDSDFTITYELAKQYWEQVKQEIINI
jgi:hypothetical protein